MFTLTGSILPRRCFFGGEEMSRRVADKQALSWNRVCDGWKDKLGRRSKGTAFKGSQQKKNVLKTEQSEA
jgi:hypothetical protein